ncbi:MAG: glycerophosphodiester phosphodiesterase [Ruminococcaceae bacterium]|nr:glycerophosphodiester phosphodiesterase [Oscillospiraceae bacterium]
MKKKILLSIFSILFVSILIFIIILVSNQTELKKLKNEPINLPKNFTYTAHTGCVDTKDNSLEAIEIGAKFGADIIEFDLNFLPDGTPVLAHDKPKGNEITLDEAFKKVSEYENLKVNVDAKSVANLKAVYPLAQKHGIESRIFYTGIELKDVEAVKKDSPEASYYLNIDVEKPKKQTPEYLQSLVDEVKGCGAIGINFNKDNATKELVEIFHKNDLLVSIWTVNKEKEMYEILHLAPDNITTRNPDKLKEILD